MDIFKINEEIFTSGIKANGSWRWKGSGALIKLKGINLNESIGLDGNCLSILKRGNILKYIEFKSVNCDLTNRTLLCQQKNYVFAGVQILGAYSEQQININDARIVD